MKLSKAMEGFFLSMAGDGYSRNTVGIYQWALGILCEYLNDPEIKNIGKDQLLNFWVWIRNEYQPKRKNRDTSPLSPASIENIWIAIRSFYNWAEIELGVKRQDQHLKRPKYQSPIVTPLKKEEIKLLLDAIKKCPRRTRNRNEAIILLMLDTGLRVGEVARLRSRDIDLENGTVEVAPYSTGAKTTPRIVYIGKATIKALWLYIAEKESLSPNAPLFTTQENYPMKRNSIRHMVKRLAENAGVPDCYPHKFRHTFAIEFLRNGGNVFTLQRLLGHSSLTMVKKYLKINNVDLETAHKHYSPVDRWRF